MFLLFLSLEKQVLAGRRIELGTIIQDSVQAFYHMQKDALPPLSRLAGG